MTNNSKTIIVTAITIIEVTIIKFYNRDQEKKQLNDITSQTNQYGRMTVITGRRIGKTMLSLAVAVAQQYKYLYLFISKK